MERIAPNGDEIFKVASAGECIEVDDEFIMKRKPIEHEVRIDEAGSFRYQGYFCHLGC
ncbi:MULTISPECIES: hypothetical protein [unclassified Rhizobium]|uniref:hypothetical protein n=1 Tax=unclassified Rhizobium TaxID=2613769 RepID=UPI001495DE96|nr:MULTISPECIES: hypothetical protein [unclassified Rhizobium]